MSEKKIKKAFLSLACIICFSMLCGCSGKNNTAKYDYYGDCKFELPFKYEKMTETDGLYFNAKLSIDQMTEEIRKAGYQASVYDFDGVKRILITVKKGDISSYFIIFDKTLSEYLGNGASDKYVLENLSESIRVTTDNANYDQYEFLFPRHVSDILKFPNGVIDAELMKTRKIYCTFKEFVDFYKATGKNDTLIDAEKKTVTFTCKESTEKNGANANIAKGKVTMRYVENATGNYIDIQHTK